jgi:glycosyltransferase involved in cell wall biosynthesis
MDKASMKASAGRVLMLVEQEFPRDTRVRNEAFTLAANGLQVSIIALRGAGEKPRESLNGVTVYRLPRLTVFRKLPDAERSRIAALANKLGVLVGYVAEYGYFTAGCLILSCYIAWKDGFDVVHAHNPPDTLFIVGAFHKLFGKKFVFDHHDLSPELYQSRYTTPSGLVSRGLALCEKASVKTADVVIATNESYREIDIRRNGIEPAKVFIVRNGPDLGRVRLTDPDPALRGKARMVLGYLGAMNPQDGVDYMLRSLHHLRYQLKRSDFYCVAIGAGDSFEALKSLAVDLRLEDCLMFTGFISDQDMVRLLSTVDICLDPNPSSPLNDVSTWIKVMEYMALGKPVVSFDLKETRVSAADAAVYVKPNDEAAFAGAIARLMDDPAERARMAEVGRTRIHNQLSWQVTSKKLMDAYEFLLGRAARPEGALPRNEAARDA